MCDNDGKLLPIKDFSLGGIALGDHENFQKLKSRLS